MRLYRKSLQLLLPILLLLPMFLQSCSSDSTSADRRKELLSLVNDDAIIVLATDPSAILKSAGAEVKDGRIMPSKELERMASKNNDAVKFLVEISEAKGFDFHNLVASVNAHSFCILFCLSDPDDFASWICKKDFTKTTSGQYTIFSNDGLSIAVNGDIAMITDWEDDETEAIAAQALAITESAKANPLKSWKADRLCAAQTDMIYNLDGLAEALKDVGVPNIPTKYYAENCKFATLSLTLDGPTLKMNGESYDAEGHKTPMMEKGTYTPIQDETLAMIKGYQLAWAFSVPESFSKMLTEMYSRPEFGNMMPKERAELIGTIFETVKSMGMGISIKDGANLFNFSAKDLSAVATASYDKDKLDICISEMAKLNLSKDDISQIKTYCESIIDGKTGSISLNDYVPGLKIYYTWRNDNFTMATDEKTVSDRPSLLNTPRDVLSYATLNLPKSHILLSLANCPFGIYMEGYAYDDSYEGELKLTDCEGGLISNIIKFLSKI